MLYDPIALWLQSFARIYKCCVKTLITRKTAVNRAMIRLPDRANRVKGTCWDSKETTWLFGILCYTACQRINSKGHSSDATIAVNTSLSVKDIARLKCSMNRKQTEMDRLWKREHIILLSKPQKQLATSTPSQSKDL